MTEGDVSGHNFKLSAMAMSVLLGLRNPPSRCTPSSPIATGSKKLQTSWSALMTQGVSRGGGHCTTHGGAADVALALDTRRQRWARSRVGGSLWLIYYSHFPQEWTFVRATACVPVIRRLRKSRLAFRITDTSRHRFEGMALVVRRGHGVV